MNPTEQKNHRIVTDDLAKTIRDFSDITADRFTDLERRIQYFSDITADRFVELERRIQVAEGKTLERIAAARDYLRDEDVKLSQCCQERWDISAQTNQKLAAALYGFRDRGFWSRLNWILRGQ